MGNLLYCYHIISDTFIKTVRKYTRAKTLSERMLNELIKKVVVYHAEKVDGVYVQKLEIHWNCAGVGISGRNRGDAAEGRRNQ